MIDVQVLCSEHEQDILRTVKETMDNIFEKADLLFQGESQQIHKNRLIFVHLVLETIQSVINQVKNNVDQNEDAKIALSESLNEVIKKGVKDERSE